MINRIYYKKPIPIIFMCCFLLITAAAAKAETTRIAIFPFNIHSAENLDYMQAGLYEMLANRLGSADSTVMVIPRKEIAEKNSAAASGSLQKKFDISRTFQADYFVSGSLTALGANISTDLQFYNLSQSMPLVRLSRTGTLGDVIAHIDEFASMVNQKVLNRTAEVPEPSDIEEADAKAEVPIKGLSVVTQESSGKGRWQSETFKAQFKGVSVGDVDGDGTNEIVFIDKNKIYIYRYTNNRFEKFTQVVHGQYMNFLNADVADINANGRAEVFITSYGKLSEQPNSYIYEYKDNGLFQISNETRLYYRVINDSDGPSILLAQKKVANLTFVEKFYKMIFEKGEYVSIDTITPPKVFTIYNMAFTHNIQDGKRLFVGYGRDSEITAWSNEGKILWESGEPAGGSLNFIEYSDRESMDKARHYLSKRILLADTDDNGNQEFIAIKNINSSPEWMSKARRYKRGYITCLEWDPSGALQTKWKTDEERGYISDIALGDATNDGKVDLVFTVVSDVKRKADKSSSYIVIQQLP